MPSTSNNASNAASTCCSNWNPAPPVEAGEACLSASSVKSLFSVSFKTLCRELQGAAVLRDCPDGMVGDTTRELGLDFQGHAYLRTVEAGKVRHHFVGNAAGVSAHPRWVECDAAVEPSHGLCRRNRRRGLLAVSTRSRHSCRGVCCTRRRR